MKVAIVADTFPPLRTSGAVQLRDLAREFVRQGHSPTVFVASPGLAQPAVMESSAGISIARLRTPRTKDVSYARRAVGEFLMPFIMLRNLRCLLAARTRWDGVIWYSPSIFLGPFARQLMRSSRCRGYLIVRDMFPDWAVDMGIMGRGLPYRLLKLVERYQYNLADVIGVQTAANLSQLSRYERLPWKRIEVLHNWLAVAPDTGCSIDVGRTQLAGRKICVYAGNMGVAQGMGVVLRLAERVMNRRDIGFLFVGRGSEALSLRLQAEKLRLDNALFFDEIDPDEIPGLLAQCHVGLVALDPRHQTHNIPGKVLTYLQAGLPLLASINAGNDLVELIRREAVGRAIVDASAESLQQCLFALLDELRDAPQTGSRCRQLAQRMFSPESAVRQIVAGLGAPERC
jgi:glycosyltransferase involved in cell wall biosynthesis